MVLPYRSPIKLEMSREGPAATARGGLVLLFEVLAAKRILVGLPRMGGSPAQGWADAQMILAMLVLNIVGLDSPLPPIGRLQQREHRPGEPERPCAGRNLAAKKISSPMGKGIEGGIRFKVR